MAFDTIKQHLKGQPKAPPLHLWHPDLSGDIDIIIKANGDWFHEGELIQRKSLVNLFASILRRENDGHYYLVAPGEKWRIKVEDAPIMIIDMDVIDAAKPTQQIVFTTNVEGKFLLSKKYPLSIFTNPDTGEPNPKLQLDNNLTAKINRSVFYRLANCALENEGGFAVLSDGYWYHLDNE